MIRICFQWKLAGKRLEIRHFSAAESKLSTNWARFSTLPNENYKQRFDLQKTWLMIALKLEIEQNKNAIRGWIIDLIVIRIPGFRKLQILINCNNCLLRGGRVETTWNPGCEWTKKLIAKRCAELLILQIMSKFVQFPATSEQTDARCYLWSTLSVVIIMFHYFLHSITLFASSRCRGPLFREMYS